jgi:histidine triad (HIT) family protein
MTLADDCIFCKIVSKEIPSTLLREEDDVLAFRDINPAAPSHILVIPRKHIAKLSEAEPADAELLGKLLLTAADVAKAEDLKGFRIVINNGATAGQTVWHIHIHVLGGRPLRWPPG